MEQVIITQNAPDSVKIVVSDDNHLGTPITQLLSIIQSKKEALGIDAVQSTVPPKQLGIGKRQGQPKIDKMFLYQINGNKGNLFSQNQQDSDSDFSTIHKKRIKKAASKSKNKKRAAKGAASKSNQINLQN